MKKRNLIKAGLLASAIAAVATLGQAATAPTTAWPLVNPADIGKTPVDNWLTYHGDWSGRRYSTLKTINETNVKDLKAAWVFRPNTGSANAILSGDGATPAAEGGIASSKATPLLHNGVLYITAVNHIWAIDARTGQEKWHYLFRAVGGSSIGNRGVGISGNNIFFVTNDNYFVAVDAQTGVEKYKFKTGNTNLQMWTTVSPTIIRNHAIYGIGTDRYDFPAYLESRDPATGELQWQWRVTPAPGEPGFETWPNEMAAKYGGGTPWVPGTYDEDQNLYIFGTGNPQAVLDGRARKGDNLYTGSIVAINPDTGKMKWAYQVGPHDTHDWDASITPILVDGTWQGRPRKLVLVANRNGYFFVIDRVTGRGLASYKMHPDLNWAKTQTRRGTFQPEEDPNRALSIGGSYVRPGTSPGFTNWQPHAFNPETGLFYVGYNLHASIFYTLYDGPEPRGWAAREQGLGTTDGGLMAIDYRTGRVVWHQETARTPNPTSGITGLLTTAGNLVFGSDGGGNFTAWNAKTGKPLWRSAAGNNSNGPITYMLDGKQYVLANLGAAGLHAFALN